MRKKKIDNYLLFSDEVIGRVALQRSKKELTPFQVRYLLYFR